MKEKWFRLKTFHYFEGILILYTTFSVNPAAHSRGAAAHSLRSPCFRPKDFQKETMKLSMQFLISPKFEKARKCVL